MQAPTVKYRDSEIPPTGAPSREKSIAFLILLELFTIMQRLMQKTGCNYGEGADGGASCFESRPYGFSLSFALSCYMIHRLYISVRR